MKWTTDKPTKLGPYHVRETEAHPWIIVRIESKRGELQMLHFGLAHVIRLSVVPTAQWAGPIEEPTDD